MTDLDALQLSLTISAPDNDDDQLDDMTRQLFMELKDLNVESVNLSADSHAPTGTKGVDPLTAGTIALAVLPAMLPKVLEFLQSWTLQGKGRTIKFKGKVGKEQIEYEGSLADMEKLLANLEKKNREMRNEK